MFRRRRRDDFYLRYLFLARDNKPDQDECELLYRIEVECGVNWSDFDLDMLILLHRTHYGRNVPGFLQALEEEYRKRFPDD